LVSQKVRNRVDALSRLPERQSIRLQMSVDVKDLAVASASLLLLQSFDGETKPGTAYAIPFFEP
jgi:hypothetical protein